MKHTHTTGRVFDSRVATRTTDKQRAAMERAAKRAGLDLGTWARVVLVAASSKAPALADGLIAAAIAGRS